MKTSNDLKEMIKQALESNLVTGIEFAPDGSDICFNFLYPNARRDGYKKGFLMFRIDEAVDILRGHKIEGINIIKLNIN
ncbi:MAG: hypothetical protein LBU37_10640 [Tannerellaceae bacterium]|jgi:hypothetical protein|nr:hypothetical protein [Tannerellaceae bacterium]